MNPELQKVTLPYFKFSVRMSWLLLRLAAAAAVNCGWIKVYSVSQKIPPPPRVFLTFSPNGWEFLVQI